MRRVCPQCQGAFEAQFLCPNCGVQLLDLPDRATILATQTIEEVDRSKGLAPRVLAGLILAQGLYYGLHQLWTAAVLAGLVPEHVTLAARPFLVPALQVLGVLAGGLIAGAGNSRGMAAGFAIGIVNALVFLLPLLATGKRPADFLLFGAWLPLAVFGAAGGLIARKFWPSLNDIPDPALAPKETKAPKKAAEPLPPIAWLRVLGGAALSVGCTVWAGSIRDGFISSGGGSFVVESRLQAQFVAWVIAALAMVLGGAFAGATSHGGLKHGFLVGLLASAAIFVIHHHVVKEAFPPEQFFASLFDLANAESLSSVQTGAFLLTNTLMLGTFGGFFGGMLLPKIVARKSGSLDRAAV